VAKVSMELVKKLREMSGAGMLDCKNALEEADGELEKAFTILREKGIAKAVKKAGRATGQGVVEAYLHKLGNDFPPQVGVLVEVDCETDFVAKGEDFRKLAKELALQIAATSPRWVSRDEVPDEVLVAERAVFEAKAQQDGKPEQVIPKIVEGQVEKLHQGELPVGAAALAGPEDHHSRSDRREHLQAAGEHRRAQIRPIQRQGGVTSDALSEMGDRSPKYNRVLLKLSGEALGGARDYGIDLSVVQAIAGQVKRVHEMGVQIALVVGGGNIFRGMAASELGFDRATGDYMGMLATVINALALQDALERIGIPARTMTAIQMPQVAEPYIRRRAVRHLEKGRVVILAAGTGNPYFTTDTTAALRAVEIEADIILKATKVDGVYTADPKLDPTAVKLDHLDYLEVLNRGIEVMDNTAVTLCMDNDVPILVFNLLIPGNIERVILGEEIGTLVGASRQ